MADPILDQTTPAKDTPEPAGIRLSTALFGLAAATFFGGWLVAMMSSPNLFDALTGYQFAEASGSDSMVEAARLNDAILPLVWVTAIAAILAIAGGVIALVQRRRPFGRSEFSQAIARACWGALGVFAGITLIVTGSAFASAALALASDATDLRDSTASNIELAQAAYDSAKIVEDNAWASLKAAKASNESSGYGWCSFWQADYVACELSKSRVDEAQNSLTAAQRGTSDAGSELNAELTEQQRIEPIVQQLLNQASIAEPVRIGTLIAGIAIAVAALGLLVFGIRGAVANRPTEGFKFTAPKLSLPSSVTSSTKRCPKCDEKIRESATICKHCGSDLS